MKRLLTACIALAVVIVGFGFSTKIAEAGTYPLKGYAWSETIGWISFNGSNYGVIVDSANGAMTGFAWSENLGWLSFNPSDTAGCGTAANLNVQTGVLDGWAKFLVTAECVHLKGSNYGVTYNQQSREFSGYSWGGDLAGWMKWKNNSPAYSVYTDSPIVAPPEAPTSLTIDTAAPSGKPVSKTTIDLRWTDNASGETGFKFERKIGAGGTWSQIALTNPNVTTYDDTGLAGGTLYYYRVRATNNGGDSIYSNEISTTTLPYTATINVDVNPNSGTWTVNPGSINRTGDTSVTVNPSGTGTLYTITAGDPPAGYDPNPTITNSITGSGSSFTLFNDSSVNVTITYQRSFNYTLSNDGDETIQKGGGSYVAYGQVVVNKTRTSDSGPSKQVDISVSGLPSGVTVNGISNNPCSPDCSSTITLAVSSSAAAGTYPITVTGSPLSKTTSFNLTIENSPDVFVSCTHTGTPQVGQSITWLATVTQTPSLAPYTYYWTGTNVPTDPAPSTQSFAITYSTTGTKTTNVLVTDSKGNTAVCNPQGTVNIGVNPSFQEF